MITFLFLLAGLVTSLQAEEYPAQQFFSNNDSGVFKDSESGHWLRSIVEEGQTFFLEQNGDLFEEDVATIEDEVLGFKSEMYSFRKSKRLLATEVYSKRPVAFYSACRYTIKEKKLIPNPQSCGFHYRKNKARSERIEWEHVVPAWLFGHQLQCWQKGGRLNCRKTNALFKQMEADMHNLVPAIGEINGDRSNYKYGIIEDELRMYGRPDIEVSFSQRLVEPPSNVYGDIARIYFYMADQYNLKLSQQQTRLLIAWNNLDPVDEWELEKNKKVKELQGNENLYVSHYKKMKQGNRVESSPADTLEGVKTELLPHLSFLFDYLPVQIAEVLLVLIAIFVIWRRRSNKKKITKITPPKPTKKKLSNEGLLVTNDKSSDQSNAPPKPNNALGFVFAEAIDTNQSYYLKTQLVDKCLTIDNDGKLIILEKQEGNELQHWQLVKTNKTEGFVFIKQKASKQVLEVNNHLAKDGSKIVLSNKKVRRNNHQEWRLIADDKQSGWYFIRNRETGYYLDVLYKKTHNGARVASYHKKIRGYENQLWQLIAVEA